MLLQFVVALMAVYGLVNPVPASPLPDPDDARYAVAMFHHERIMASIKNEALARAEAERIQSVNDAEYAAALAEEARQAALAAESAQRTIQQAQQAAQERATPRPAVVTPVSTVTTAAAPQAPQGVYLGDALRAALAQTPWPAETWATIERIVRCESGGKTSAVNGQYYGLMQQSVNLHGHPGYDAVSQLSGAYGVYVKQGWGAWECY